MAAPTTTEKLAILADAAKYDASCASSGGERREATGKGPRLGSMAGNGICHSYTPDGRCVSLLKLLLTNHCVYDCLYCVNRASSDVRRARFTPDEVVDLTLDFYKRNYIEGLFLSSGVIRSPNYTMEQVIGVARRLRELNFVGYIHLKTIPEADQALIDEAGLYADRLSMNVETPSSEGLARLAPQKDSRSIRRAMAGLRLRIEDSEDAGRRYRNAPRFAPAGQSTQMVVGADGESDVAVMRSSAGLYASYGLRRVYYSAYSPIPGSDSRLPAIRPPLVREHRLYQADWLQRFYGFTVDEIASATTDGMLDPDLDPKTAWALANRHVFPVDVNAAPPEMLLRVPGLGAKAVAGVVSARRQVRLGLDGLAMLTRSIARVRPFVIAKGWHPGPVLDRAGLPARMRAAGRQLSLF